MMFSILSKGGLNRISEAFLRYCFVKTYPSRISMPVRFHQKATTPVYVAGSSLSDEGKGIAYASLIKAATVGNNIGCDEYPTYDSFEARLRTSNIFSLTQSVSETDSNRKHGELMYDYDLSGGFALIGPCRLARGVHSCLAELQFIYSDEALTLNQTAFEHCMRRSEQIAENAGYSGSVVQVSASCFYWIEWLRNLGYLVTACLPQSVDIADRGLTDSLVFYKKLRLPIQRELPHFVDESLVDAYDSFFKEDWFPGSTTGLPTAIDIAGTSYLVRDIDSDEIELLYNFYVQAAGIESGYSVDELSPHYFRRHYLSRSSIIIFEDKECRMIARAIFVRPSPYVRNNLRTCCAYAILGNPRYQKAFPSSETSPLMDKLSLGLGYQTELATLRSGKMLTVALDVGMGSVGSLPRGIYMARSGWSDLFFMFKTFSNQLEA